MLDALVHFLAQAEPGAVFVGAKYYIVITLALLSGLYMAWSIGANDVANAMGTSVGSGALTLKRAILVAAVLEFAGAFLVGQHVTETIRKGILPIEELANIDGGQKLYVYGMMGALLAAAVWLMVATFYGLPVSTTHSIVGSVLGFGCVVFWDRLEVIHWGTVGTIVSSWVVSPLLAGVCAFIIFVLIQRLILFRPDMTKAARRVAPFLVFLVVLTMALVTVYKGLAPLKLNLSGKNALIVAVSIGLLGALVSIPFIRRVRVREAPPGDSGGAQQFGTEHWGTPEMRATERIFVYLQILSACAVAFAHGANDVANAVGPLSGIVAVVQQGALAAKAQVASGWGTGILALGGVGIVLGLATWGWRVIETIGTKITELTPTRGFAAEFGAAATILIASRTGLPISTTHTLVGAVLGVGFARGIGALNMRVIRQVVISWVVTLPAGAILAIIFFYIFKWTFGV